MIIKCKKCNKMQNFNKKYDKNTILIKNKIKSALIFIDMILVSSAMVSGMNNLLEKVIHDGKIYVFAVFVLCVVVLLCFGIKGLAKLDFVVLAISLFFMLFMILNLCGIVSNDGGEIAESVVVQKNGNVLLPMVFAVLYVFMNIISIQPVTMEFDRTLSKKQINVISIIFSLILVVLLSIFILFLNKNAFFISFSMPFLEYFSRCDLWVYVLYVIGLFLALAASYLSCLVGVKRGIGAVVKNNFVSSVLSVALSLVIGTINFTFFVSVVYPIIGAINIVIFLLMWLFCMKYWCNKLSKFVLFCLILGYVYISYQQF